jgi:hypothetical protein
MRYSSRFFLYAPFAGLLLLAGIAMIHWWIVATALAQRLDAANGHEIMPGVRLSFSERRLAGFPFRIDTILEHLRIEVAEMGGPIVWTSDGFAMHGLTYGPVQMILEAAGRQTLSWQDANGGTHNFVFLPGTFRASALLQHDKLIRFDAEIVDLAGQEFRTGNTQLHVRSTPSGFDLYLRLQNAHVTAGYAAALGPNLPSLIASGHADHPAQLENLQRGAEAPETALEDWRQAGGTIAVSDLSVEKSARASSFTGSLHMDDSHDLAGTLHAKDGSTLRFAGNRLTQNSGPARP